MSRKIRYKDDVIGEINTYISNDDSDKIIEMIKKARKDYHKEDDIFIE